MAGVTSVTFTYPMDIVRTRLSVQSASFKELGGSKHGQKLPGMFALMVTMYKTEGGWTALYRGIIPTVAGVAPYVGLNFMIYEGIRTWFTLDGQTDPGALAKLASGAASGAISQSITYPLDVLRRRFQVNTMAGMGFQYTSMADAIKSILRQEGYKGFYKGLTPNLLKVAPSMAANWLSFEMARDFFMSLSPEVEL